MLYPEEVDVYILMQMSVIDNENHQNSPEDMAKYEFRGRQKSSSRRYLPITGTIRELSMKSATSLMETPPGRILPDMRTSDVRFIYIPPCAVAAAHYIGDEPEMNANKLLDDYVQEKSLHKLKPDLRRFGFNHPNPTDDTGWHGYEAWVTIPDEMVIAAPLVKKKFSGGLYAAHMISFGDFNEWDAFLEYIMENKKYEFAGDMQDQEHMCGLLEEHLNYYSHIEQSGRNLEELQLDLLMPVRVKVNDKYEITR